MLEGRKVTYNNCVVTIFSCKNQFSGTAIQAPAYINSRKWYHNYIMNLNGLLMCMLFISTILYPYKEYSTYKQCIVKGWHQYSISACIYQSISACIYQSICLMFASCCPAIKKAHVNTYVM